MTELFPAIADTLTWSDEITLYDQEHFITYARLLDAEADSADWREAARIILQCDPDQDPVRARRCWQQHLDRGKWISTTAYQALVQKIAAHQTD